MRAFLPFCVRDELLDTNRANTQWTEEFLPEDKGNRNRQFWDSDHRQQLITYVTERVDLALENHSLEVIGKSRQYERVGLPSAARVALERYRRVTEPPTDEWPLFPADHAPSKYAAYREAMGEDPDSEVPIDDVLRTVEVPPPSITKAGGRSVMKRLTQEAAIDLEDGEYLKPHDARRALGAELYEKGHSELAQSALRHKSIETTHESYSDIQAKDVAEGIDEVRD